MSSQSNKATVRRFIEEVWNAGHLAVADGLVHPDYAIPNLGQGPDAVKRNVAAYRERNAVERLINRFKQHRRVATRYEKRAANDRAMLAIAAILLWL